MLFKTSCAPSLFCRFAAWALLYVINLSVSTRICLFFPLLFTCVVASRPPFSVVFTDSEAKMSGRRAAVSGDRKGAALHQLWGGSFLNRHFLPKYFYKRRNYTHKTLFLFILSIVYFQGQEVHWGCIHKDFRIRKLSEIQVNTLTLLIF